VTPHHYIVFMQVTTPLTSRLQKPVLVDAQTEQVIASFDLPWYMVALRVSQPLHFGDYGGQWMKFLWAVLDIATIVILVTGLYLWVKRGKTANASAKAAVLDKKAQAHGNEAPVLARDGGVL